MKIRKSRESATRSLALIVCFGVVMVLADDEPENVLKCAMFVAPDKNLVADCSGQRVKLIVPNTLDENIKVLNLSYNILVHITSSSFTRYRSLIVLDLSYSYSDEYDIVDFPTCFLPLKQLFLLDLSGTCYDPDQPARYPVSLQKLKLEFCPGYESMDLSYLPILTHVFARSGNFSRIPKFHKTTPLILLDLRGSELSRARVRELSPYCLLQAVFLAVPPDTGLLLDYCRCKKLDTWLEYTAVERLALPCDKYKPAEVDPSCNYLEPEARDVQLRRECFERKSSGRVSSTIWLLLVFMVALLFVFSIPLFILIRQKSVKKVDQIESEGSFPSLDMLGKPPYMSVMKVDYSRYEGTHIELKHPVNISDFTGEEDNKMEEDYKIEEEIEIGEE